MIDVLKVMSIWHERIEKGCEYQKEPKIASIPPLMPRCEKTGGICDFNECPRVKELFEDSVITVIMNREQYDALIEEGNRKYKNCKYGNRADGKCIKFDINPSANLCAICLEGKNEEKK